MVNRQVLMFKDGEWVDWNGSNDVNYLIVKETMTVKEYKQRFPNTPLPEEECDCHNHDHQVCDICQGITVKGKDKKLTSDEEEYYRKYFESRGYNYTPKPETEETSPMPKIVGQLMSDQKSIEAGEGFYDWMKEITAAVNKLQKGEK